MAKSIAHLQLVKAEEPTDGHWPLGTEVTFPCAEIHSKYGDCSKAHHTLKVIACECGAKPKKPSSRISTQHVWHQSHRRSLRLQPVEYVWPDDRYMKGLSIGGYMKVRNAKWEDGQWVRA